MGNLWYLNVFIMVAICKCEDEAYVTISETLSHKYIIPNWMDKIEDNKLLSAISIPGTHQSSKSLITSTPKFQTWGLHNQLDAGVRYFEVHVSSDSFKYDQSGSVQEKETFRYVWKTLQVFVKKWGRETVLLRVIPDESVVAAVTKKFRKSKFPLWRNKKIPTMSQVRGKVVLIQSSRFKLGLPIHITELDVDMGTKEMQMRQNIKLASEKCDHDMMLSYTGAKGESEDPLEVAKTINRKVNDYLLDLKGDTSRPHCVGIIAMDFPGPKVIQTIINFNGKLGEVIVGDTDGKKDNGPPEYTDDDFETEDEEDGVKEEESHGAHKEHPAEEGETPAEEGDSHGAHKEHPAEEGETPAEQEHPAEEEKPPAEEESHDKDEEHPAEEEKPPAEEESHDKDEEHPAEEEKPPAEEESHDKDEEHPAEEEHPSEEEKPPAEEESHDKDEEHPAEEEHPSEEEKPPAEEESHDKDEEHPAEEEKPPAEEESHDKDEEHPAEEEKPPAEKESHGADVEQEKPKRRKIIKVKCHKVHAKHRPSPQL